MIGRFTQITDKFKNAGLHESMPVGLNLRIKMTNIICMLIMFTGILMLAFLHISDLHEKLFLSLELSLIYGMIILLNYFRLYNISRIAFVLFTNALVFFIAVRDGSDTGNSFYYFLLPLGTLIVFDVTEKTKIILSILLGLGNYFVVYLYDFSEYLVSINYAPADVPFLNYISFSIYIILITLLSYFFVNSFRVINNELMNEQRRFDELERLAHVGSWRVTPPSRVIVASDELLKIFGFDKKDNPIVTPKAFFSRIHIEDRRKVYDGFRNVIAKNEFNEVSYRITLPGKKIRYVTSRAMPGRDDEGKVVHVDGALINLTRQVEMRNRLAQNIKEKETLLAEMHHRVKNNLAVISGLIQLQSFKVDPQSQLQFFEIHNKISTIALIHEKFYQSESLTKINLVNFVRDLEKQIALAIPVKNVSVTTDFRIDNIYLAINNAIPTALILNELITNSYKHAFEGMSEGKISIKIHKVDDSFVLHYKDNGKGMPEGVDFTDSKNQGLSLISMLAKNMHYEFTTTNQNGFYLTMFKAEIAVEL